MPQSPGQSGPVEAMRPDHQRTHNAESARTTQLRQPGGDAHRSYILRVRFGMEWRMVFTSMACSTNAWVANGVALPAV